jgi:hypothetical protein
VLRNSKFTLTALFSCFCNWNKLLVDVRIIGGCPPLLQGSASSFEVASVPEAWVSMSAALRGAKNFGWRPPCCVCLRRVTFWSALTLSLKFRWFSRWLSSSASVILGNHPPAFLFPWCFWYCHIYAMQEFNLESRSRDYATIDEAVFSPCRADLCRVVSCRASPRSFLGDTVNAWMT